MADKLRVAGYNVSVQPFTFPYFQETGTHEFERLTPTFRDYVFGTDFSLMEYSGAGDVTGEIVPTNDIVIPPGATASTSNSGCEATDFPASTAGRVALIQRGTCDFVVKARTRRPPARPPRSSSTRASLSAPTSSTARSEARLSRSPFSTRPSRSARSSTRSPRPARSRFTS